MLTEEDASTLLMINEIYQETVRKHLDIIETKLNHIRNMKSKLEKHHSRQRTPRAFTFSQKDCYPFFQDVKGLGPDLSDHTIKAQNDCTKFVSSKCTSKINSQILDCLKQRIIDQIRDALRTPIIKLIDNLKLDEDRDDVEYSEALEKLDEISSITDDELLKNDRFTQLIDWTKLSRQNDIGLTKVSCKAILKNLLCSSINKSNWTMEETKNLLRIGDEIKDWVVVSERLGTKRSPYLCFKRYMEKECERELSYLAQDELIKLKQIVSDNQIGYFIVWNNVSYQFQKRTKDIIMYSYRKMETQITRKWSGAEIRKLMDNVKKKGYARCNWLEVSRRIPGKSILACVRKYGSLCRQEFKNPSVLDTVFYWYDILKSSDNIYKKDHNISSNIICLLNSCSLNEIIYKWIRAQRESMRLFLLTYYRNPDFTGPVPTPYGNLIYIHPIVKMKSRDTSILSSELAKRSIEKLQDMQNKGIHPVLPSISMLSKIISQSHDEHEVFEKIQEFNYQTESLARKKNLWQLQNFNYSSKTRSDRVEYLHCFVGACYTRMRAPLESETCETVDDIVTAIDFYDYLFLLRDDEALSQITIMLSILEELILTGLLACRTNIRFADVSRLLLDAINKHSNVKSNPIVLLASYIKCSLDTAKFCSASHFMTAHYIVHDKQHIPSNKQTHYSDHDCFVCLKLHDLMHKKPSIYLINYSNLVNKYLPFDPHRFCSTSVRQTMVKMHNKIAQMPSCQVKPPKGNLYAADKVAIQKCMKNIIYEVTKMIDKRICPLANTLNRQKLCRYYRQSAAQRFNCITPKSAYMVKMRSLASEGSRLIDEVTKRMINIYTNKDWSRRQTTLIYSIISSLIVRIEKQVALVGVPKTRGPRGVPPSRKSARISAKIETVEKKKPAPEEFQINQKPARKHRNVRRRIGRPIAKSTRKNKKRNSRIQQNRLVMADYAYGISQTEKFIFFSQKFKANLDSMLTTYNSLSPALQFKSSHLMKRVRLAISLNSEDTKTVPDMETFAHSCRLCLNTLLASDFKNNMLSDYLQLLNSRTGRTNPSQSKKSITRKNTRFALKLNNIMSTSNFASDYWIFAFWHRVDIQSCSLVRDRIRLMLKEPMKQLLMEAYKGDSKACEQVGFLDQAKSIIRESITSCQAIRNCAGHNYATLGNPFVNIIEHRAICFKILAYMILSMQLDELMRLLVLLVMIISHDSAFCVRSDCLDRHGIWISSRYRQNCN
ncbi:hypothetical protein GJ496_008654 [Pomphorhynchus laevis]|nr:hypothetical protein GJ496_008654 [Pomphorhynchus laevis]